MLLNVPTRRKLELSSWNLIWIIRVVETNFSFHDYNKLSYVMGAQSL